MGPYGVGLWKFIRSGWVKFSKFLKFEVGNGTRIQFWDDIWCCAEPLKAMFPDLYRIACVPEATVADHMQVRGGAVTWEVHFIRMAHDWELESFSSFLDVIYAATIKNSGLDKLVWIPSLVEGFQVRSYYQVLSSSRNGDFPWKIIWKSKVPPRVAFFSWTAALGKILTVDNLRKRHIVLVSWCCMCKADGESVDHLLLHCSVAKDFWDMLFAMFGVHWVMPYRVIDLFACWPRRLGSLPRSVLWRAAPHCLMWCIWKERNARLFEGSEKSVIELKLQFMRSLAEWMAAFGSFGSSNLIDFLDICSN
jgi:hypothetical protein